jgi:superfamily II DNA or RNA helicase
MDESNIYENIKLQLEIFNKNYKEEFDRIKKLGLPDDTINQIVNGRYDYCNLSQKINKILIKNQDDFLKYLNYIRSFIEKQYINGRSNKRIEEKLFNKIADLKLNFNEIYETLLKWLLNNNFIENVINNSDLNIIDESDIPSPSQPLNIFVPRINQKEAIDRLNKNGLETGIHCQATGCGKTFIILAYIDYCIKKFGSNCKIIFFTERVNILRDLFDFVSKKSTEPNQKKIEEWKNLGIADLTKLKIINRVTIKKRDFTELLNNSKEPTMLVINRAFLTSRKIYQGLDDISLILHDECHNTSSNKCHEFLQSQKEKKIPIVGFSATPLRTGKKDLPKLKEIYDQDEPLLTNYNMIFAIENNLILPPNFYWYQINNNNDDINKNNLISKKEVITVLLLLSNIKKKMPNKKIIAWCGRIDLAREWKKQFELNHKDFQQLENFKFFIDTSRDKNVDYKLFKNLDSEGILFCANKHREGSDIRKLDGCIFLDAVKNRGSIPFIQSIGRVLRVDPENENKKKGFVIEGIFKDEDYEKTFFDKIISYYLNLENILGELNNDGESKSDKYIRIREMINFNSSKDEITINFGENNKIIINLNELGWDDAIKNFDGLLQKKISISAEDNLRYKGKKLVSDFNFNLRTDFYQEYQNIPSQIKEEYELPDIDLEEYSNILRVKTWFDILNIKHNYYDNMKEAKISLKNQGIKLINAKNNWLQWSSKDKRLPPYPKYLWKNKFNYSFFREREQNILFL